MTNIEAILIMCRRCINFEVCNGTGCEPRNTLENLITETELKKDGEQNELQRDK